MLVPEDMVKRYSGIAKLTKQKVQLINVSSRNLDKLFSTIEIRIGDVVHCQDSCCYFEWVEEPSLSAPDDS